MSKTTKMLLVVDAAGRVIAAAHEVDESSQKGMSTGIMPLPGQRILRVDVPEQIANLKSGSDLHLALSQIKAGHEAVGIEFKEIRTKHAKH